jgi:hypothetical protein
MSRSVTIKQLDDESSAGWTTYGTSRAAFSFFQHIAKRHERFSLKLVVYLTARMAGKE